MLSVLHFPGINVFGAFVSLCYDDCWPSFSMYFRGTGWWMWFSVAAAPLGCVTMLAPCRAATRVLWGHGQVTSQSLLRGATGGVGQPALFETLADLHLLNVLFFYKMQYLFRFFFISLLRTVQYSTCVFTDTQLLLTDLLFFTFWKAQNFMNVNCRGNL